MAKNQILVIGAVGAGAYLAYEYWQYSQLPAATQQANSFWAYLLANWGIGTAAPATTATTTAPTTTTAVQANSPTTTTTGTPTTPAAPTSVLQTLQQTAGQGTYIQTASGAVLLAPMRAVPVAPTRGTTALLPNRGATAVKPATLPFVEVPTSPVRGGTRGVGAVRVLPGPAPINTAANMLYQSHHPLPYIPGYHMRGMRGLGAATQATGMEKALYGRQFLRSNRIR